MKKFLETATPLGASGTYTGVTRPVNDTPDKVEVFAEFLADQASANNGAQLQGSDDGTNWFVIAQGTLTASVPLALSAVLLYANYRVVLTNGGTAQTSLQVKSGVTG